ncbi:hypothetical protein DQM68_17855 [Leptospira mayottensis]|nr:hypothetical protein DQM68_17855 [Leptospira mayottensis]
MTVPKRETFLIVYLLNPLPESGKDTTENFTHTGIFTYALDFTLSEGSPILAAREGLVINTR